STFTSLASGLCMVVRATPRARSYRHRIAPAKTLATNGSPKCPTRGARSQGEKAMSNDEKGVSEQLIAVANSVPSLRPHGSFTLEERARLAKEENDRMAKYYADLTERQNERYAREHLAVLCQELVKQRHRLLRYPEPDRLVVAAVQAMQQRLPG